VVRREVVFAVESGEVEIEFDDQRRAVGNKVAQEYQIVYGVELDEHGKLAGGEPDRVDGQYNIYDSVPGMPQYSPLWQFNYVVVPRDSSPTRCVRKPTAWPAAFPSRRARSWRTDLCCERRRARRTDRVTRSRQPATEAGRGGGLQVIRRCG